MYEQITLYLHIHKTALIKKALTGFFLIKQRIST